MSDWPWDLIFEVDFDTNPGALPSTWTDLSDRIHSRVELSSGLGRSGQYSGDGFADLNNRDRALDPTNPAATYNLVPWRHSRFRVTVGASTYNLWRGYIKAWAPSWPQYNQGLIDARFVDALAWLAMRDRDVDFPAQETHERVTAILDLAGWPAELRDIDDGVVRLDAYEQQASNLRRVLEDTADAEDGTLYVAPDGKITFRNRHHRFDATSQLTIGSTGVPVSRVRPAYDDDILTNLARVELANGDVFEAEDTASVTEFGERDMSVRDLSLPEVEATALAEWIVYRYANPELWLDAVTINCRPTGRLAQVAPRTIDDLVTFTHIPPGGGDPVSTPGHIERLTHRIGKGTWETSWDLSPYFGQGPWFTLDDATLGRLDAAAGNKLAP